MIREGQRGFGGRSAHVANGCIAAEQGTIRKGITLDKVQHSYAKRMVALRGLLHGIGAGESLAIVGPSKRS